ncbi:MAG: hypothetical protein WDW38_000268 [Sanguina aurantia]
MRPQTARPNAVLRTRRRQGRVNPQASAQRRPPAGKPTRAVGSTSGDAIDGNGVKAWRSAPLPALPLATASLFAVQVAIYLGRHQRRRAKCTACDRCAAARGRGAGGERTITNVAAGQAATDAVNVALNAGRNASTRQCAANAVQYDDPRHRRSARSPSRTGAQHHGRWRDRWHDDHQPAPGSSDQHQHACDQRCAAV